MRRIEWHVEARQALWWILDDIASHSLIAAESLYTDIKEATQALPHHPYLYRPGRIPGTREIIVHPNYLVVYRVADERIDILTVAHSRLEYP